MSDEKKPFQFNSAEKIAAMSQSVTDQAIRLQERGIGSVNFDEAQMQAQFEIAIQLAKLNENFERFFERYFPS